MHGKERGDPRDLEKARLSQNGADPRLPQRAPSGALSVVLKCRASLVR